VSVRANDADKSICSAGPADDSLGDASTLASVLLSLSSSSTCSLLV